MVGPDGTKWDAVFVDHPVSFRKLTIYLRVGIDQALYIG